MSGYVSNLLKPRSLSCARRSCWSRLSYTRSSSAFSGSKRRILAPNPTNSVFFNKNNNVQLRRLTKTTDGMLQRTGAFVAADATGTKEIVRKEPNYQVMDGNQAAAHVAYATSEISFIYPISPATSMGEKMDEWATGGRKNIFGQSVSVSMMQSEAGSAGALHGAATAGALTTTFTASQGLLLMIPNMYLLAGELVPTVFHVAARSVSRHALSIFNDHSDVMSTRQTGFSILASSSVQEVMDLGLVAHISSVKARLPFLHFFDGYRTSAEMQKIDVMQYEEIAKIFPHEALKENLLNNALNPTHPRIRGTQMRPDIFMQVAVAGHKYYRAAPELIQETMNQIAALTGRQYNLFDYYGSPTADRVAVAMGSASKTIMETVDYLNSQGENVGVITTRLFRPWSAEHFYNVLPETARKIAVMDRTREEGASGCPLFLDVSVTLGDKNDVRLVTGGQYGLASKEFTPAMAKAVFNNLNDPKPKMRYIIGVEDDVTKTSLAYSSKPLNTIPEGTSQAMIFGLGGDGMVGASQTIIQLISENTELNVQGHYVYDSKKTDGLTISNLRCGPKPINSAYCVTEGAAFVMCSHPSYVHKFDFMLDSLYKGGTFVLNSPWNTLEQMETKLPAWFKKQIAEKDVQFYNIDAIKVANDVGLGKRRVNSIMSAAFWDLSGVLPQEEALKLLKNSLVKMYSHKGPEIVRMNQLAVDETVSHLFKIDYSKEKWLRCQDAPVETTSVDLPEYVKNVTNPVLAMKGDRLLVSAFEAGGSQPTGTTKFERRGLAPEIPVWEPDKCTQCNYCAIVCPHAVVRPFLLDKQESKAVPEGFEYRKAKGGSEVAGFNYTIKIAPMDCTGCAVCVQACPDDALRMAPFEEIAHKSEPWWDFAVGLKEKGEIGDKFSVKGSQFQKPLLEFSAACSGCGETPYVKLATQLFGDRMMIANATGCSSIWGSVATAIPYTKNEKGYGPAWGSSLFEDNAEYGLGMMVGMRQRRLRLAGDIKTALETVEMPEKLHDAFEKWLQFRESHEQCDMYTNVIREELHNLPQPMDPLLKLIMDRDDILRSTCQWIIGGDGWAYDIGFGGLDHVLSLNSENVNLMVLDTEMYSNTGGQMSKSTPLAAVVKYASSGKAKTKKNLALHAINYEHVYVASVAMGASYSQCVQALKEAESYPGPSLILAYSPCIDWGFDMRYMMDVQKQAVDCGYWNLYRYDPRRVAQGQNPFQLDSKRVRSDLADWIKGQNRFARLVREQKDRAKLLQDKLKVSSLELHHKYEDMAMDDEEHLEDLMKKLGVTSDEFLHKEKSIVLYGSETGNAHTLAGVFLQELKRRGVDAKCESMDDVDLEDLTKYHNIYCVVSTSGQGDFPGNCLDFWKRLSDSEVPSEMFKDSRFAIFGLGDSSYVYFNQAAKRFDQRFEELGGKRIIGMGLGDDKDDERYESKWSEWNPDLWNELGTPPPVQQLLPPTYHVQLDSSGGVKTPTEPYLAPGAKFLPLTKNELLTPEEYDRIIRHYEFDIRGSGLQYAVGDCLGIHPHNKLEEVDHFLSSYHVNPNTAAIIEDTLGRKNPLPAVISARQLFTEILDIFGRPPRRFYETLAMVAKDDSEKKELEHLLSKEGADVYKQFAKETVTYADLLEKYPSTQLSLDYVIDFIPRIKPRLYSIASSSEMYPDIIQLCIVKDDWWTPSGLYREGLCTRYIETKSLNSYQPVDHLPCRLSAAGINIPDSQRPPYIMVALGTGIAPMRAMVQEREVARQRGEAVGPMALIFGARYRATDYTYGDEFEEFHNNGILTNLSTAFSRDQEYKIYVQNRIDENPEMVYDYLVKQNGYFYLCGPAGNVPPAVRKAVCNAIVKCGGLKPEEADQMVTQMQIEGRYNVEAW